MGKLVVFCLLLVASCALVSGGHDTTGSTHTSSSSTTGSTHSSDSTDSTDSTSSDSHHHSDHHPHGSSYSSHDHDDHHRHGRVRGNQVRREARWTRSDERVLLRRMRVELDAAKLRSAGSSRASDDVSKPAAPPLR